MVGNRYLNRISIAFLGVFMCVCWSGCESDSKQTCKQTSDCTGTNVTCLAGLCQPIGLSGECTYGGKKYVDGDRFASTDGCNSCVCDKTKVACTEKACAPPTCTSEKSCPPDRVCVYANGICAPDSKDVGICELLSPSCDAMYQPVCGCDGKTYSNSCTARGSGVTVKIAGECTTKTSCEYNGETYAHGATWKIGCGNSCSCDDGQPLCSSAPCRSCGPTTACGGNEHCIYAVGTCSPDSATSGACFRKVDACDQQYLPVCGCDGKTYSNACAANNAGITILRSGECETKPQN